MIKVAVFASGSGSNAENIAQYFAESSDVEIALILTNNPKAFVLERAKKLGIPTFIFNRDIFYNSEEVVEALRSNKIDFVVLAGFMWLVPKYLVESFPNRILNIHPALLPKFGGKGMYGDNVHKAVKEAGESVSGITIHFVNEKYDEGNIIFQAECELVKQDTAETIAQKVHLLEYKHYPQVIESVIQKSIKNH